MLPRLADDSRCACPVARRRLPPPTCSPGLQRPRLCCVGPRLRVPCPPDLLPRRLLRAPQRLDRHRHRRGRGRRRGGANASRLDLQKRVVRGSGQERGLTPRSPRCERLARAAHEEQRPHPEPQGRPSPRHTQEEVARCFASADVDEITSSASLCLRFGNRFQKLQFINYWFRRANNNIRPRRRVSHRWGSSGWEPSLGVGCYLLHRVVLCGARCGMHLPPCFMLCCGVFLWKRFTAPEVYGKSTGRGEWAG